MELKPPETLKENISNEKSVVWTMGVLLYRMLYGKYNQKEKKENKNGILFPNLISKETSFMLDMIF